MGHSPLLPGSGDVDGGRLLGRPLGSLQPAGGLPLRLLGPAVAHLLGGWGAGRGHWASPRRLCLGDDKFQGLAVHQGHPEHATQRGRLTGGPGVGGQGSGGGAGQAHTASPSAPAESLVGTNHLHVLAGTLRSLGCPMQPAPPRSHGSGSEGPIRLVPIQSHSLILSGRGLHGRVW